MSSEPQAGWHQDPNQPGQLRWWDGRSWSEHTHPTQGPSPAHLVEAESNRQASLPFLTRPLSAHSAQGINGSARTFVDRKDVPLFTFNGGAGTYLGTGILAVLVTVLTLGICFPFALVLVERWKAKHTYIEGRRLVFRGTGMGLFGNWIKWLLLSVVTFGIYSFWVVPRLTKWRTEHLTFDPDHQPMDLRWSHSGRRSCSLDVVRY